ncbi:aldehyde dehydrogenase family protein [Aeromicrobium sp. 636]|uniref:Aldehyde dehydrogenase family protein n=2 Tax=Nocardioidaceae TaxID=85015 RepID=A0A8I0EW81_9ACTN|nr:aldehyde dehydrogenase family protein [Aeromicrobium senzhongii]MBC9226466.1 aldehyde dehydrogenase family protein [Aeromicrobium senzhongii]MCQ3998570.1 aldehyde dehydrogenase family protein [Aeromicrobium sp. 636]
MTSAAEPRRVGYIGARGPVVPESGEYLPILNPATGAALGEAYEVDSADLDRIIEDAHATQRNVWRATAPDARGRILRAWADKVAAHREELADLDSQDVGHLRAETLGDVDVTVKILTYYAGMADKLESRSYAQFPGRIAYGIDEPFGVVAGVSPYNANTIFAVFKAAPALVAGNAIVLKAPELAPLSTFRLVELGLEAGLPPGLVNVVTGRGAVVGPLLTEHPGIGMVAFTGGLEAGRSVIRQSATNIVPVSLELGGKSPVIILDDADLELALPLIAHSNFVKSGQSCVAGSRVFAPASRYEEIASRLAEIATAVRVGDPLSPDSQMGSLISQRHRTTVDSLVHSAVDAGATLLAGGAPVEPGGLTDGAFYAPTVLGDVQDDNPAARTEAFGPMASVLSYTDVDEVLGRANDSDFGLSAQVWGNDAASIQHLAANLEVGTVWVNAYRAIHFTVPFGGVKQSGYGRENGFEAIRLYTQSKAVVWDLTTTRADPYA